MKQFQSTLKLAGKSTLALQALALLAASKNPLVLTVVTDFWVLQALNFPSWYADRWTFDFAHRIRLGAPPALLGFFQPLLLGFHTGAP